jgi:hypothetical protein
MVHGVRFLLREPSLFQCKSLSVKDERTDFLKTFALEMLRVHQINTQFKVRRSEYKINSTTLF